LRLVNSVLDRGHHAALWDGQNARGLSAPAGGYLVRLAAGGSTVSRKIVRIAP